MAGTHGFGGQGLSDALTILGAAGIVIPAFARLKISPVIGFIIVGVIAGPFGLGAYTGTYPWLQAVTINDPGAIEPFAEFGIILLLFAIGLELSFKRLVAMRKSVFGIGAAELIGNATLIGAGLLAMGNSLNAAALLGLALAMSSTALVLPISGTNSPVGKAAFSMLLFEDLALVPLLFIFASLGGTGDLGQLLTVGWKAVLVIGVMLVAGRLLLPPLFAQAARTKSPELFQAVALLTVILASLATGGIGLSPIIGALIAGVLIAETDYRNEVEVITAPIRGLALGVFRTPAESAWPTAAAAAVGHLLPPAAPPAPDQPGMFSLVDPARVRRILTAAGFREVSLEPFDHMVQLAGRGGAAEAADFAMVFGPLTRVLPRLAQQQRDAVRRALEEFFAGHLTPEAVTLRATFWIVQARA